MTRSEQHKMIHEVAYYASKMKRDEYAFFQMLLKRDKDDEDLDLHSQKELTRLHSQYVSVKTKQDIEEKWKKLTSKK